MFLNLGKYQKRWEAKLLSLTSILHFVYELNLQAWIWYSNVPSTQNLTLCFFFVGNIEFCSISNRSLILILKYLNCRQVCKIEVFLYTVLCPCILYTKYKCQGLNWLLVTSNFISDLTFSWFLFMYLVYYRQNTMVHIVGIKESLPYQGFRGKA